MATLRSPDEIQTKAIEMMLDGRAPTTETDWALVVNFWAANVALDLEVAICRVMAILYSCPLAEADVESIALYQSELKRK